MFNSFQNTWVFVYNIWIFAHYISVHTLCNKFFPQIFSRLLSRQTLQASNVYSFKQYYFLTVTSWIMNCVLRLVFRVFVWIEIFVVLHILCRHNHADWLRGVALRCVFLKNTEFLTFVKCQAVTHNLLSLVCYLCFHVDVQSFSFIRNV